MTHPLTTTSAPLIPLSPPPPLSPCVTSGSECCSFSRWQAMQGGRRRSSSRGWRTGEWHCLLWSIRGPRFYPPMLPHAHVPEAVNPLLCKEEEEGGEAGGEKRGGKGWGRRGWRRRARADSSSVPGIACRQVTAIELVSHILRVSQRLLPHSPPTNCCAHTCATCGCPQLLEPQCADTNSSGSYAAALCPSCHLNLCRSHSCSVAHLLHRTGCPPPPLPPSLLPSFHLCTVFSPLSPSRLPLLRLVSPFAIPVSPPSPASCPRRVASCQRRTGRRGTFGPGWQLQWQVR